MLRALDPRHLGLRQLENDIQVADQVTAGLLRPQVAGPHSDIRAGRRAGSAPPRSGSSPCSKGPADLGLKALHPFASRDQALLGRIIERTGQGRPSESDQGVAEEDANLVDCCCDRLVGQQWAGGPGQAWNLPAPISKPKRGGGDVLELMGFVEDDQIVGWEQLSLDGQGCSVEVGVDDHHVSPAGSVASCLCEADPT